MPNGIEGPDGRLGQLSPFGRIGSVVNVVIAGVIMITAIVFAVTGAPVALALAAVAAWMEVRFVRVMILTYRGFYDER